MGWRYRKSINLGGGFRINLSKSGIGYSWGFPGYRHTYSPNGTQRKTYSIPGTGISYVESQGSRKNNYNNSGNSYNYNQDTKLITGNTTYYQNSNISKMGKGDELLKQINKLRTIDILANVCLILIVLFPIGILLKILIVKKWKLDLTYEMDDINQKKFDALNEFLVELKNNKRLWQIGSSIRVYNTKYNAGAGNNVSRARVSIVNKMPWYIKHNIDVYCLNLKNEKIYFTPDRMLIFKNMGGVGCRRYNDMVAGFSTTNFVETEIVPRDAEIVRYTWRYVNKSGGPDKRFNNNRQIPVCKYGEISLESEDGINILLECSNHNLMYSIQDKFTEFMNYHNKIISTKGYKEEYELEDIDSLNNYSGKETIHEQANENDKWNSFNDYGIEENKNNNLANEVIKEPIMVEHTKDNNSNCDKNCEDNNNNSNNNPVDNHPKKNTLFTVLCYIQVVFASLMCFGCVLNLDIMCSILWGLVAIIFVPQIKDILCEKYHFIKKHIILIRVILVILAIFTMSSLSNQFEGTWINDNGEKLIVDSSNIKYINLQNLEQKSTYSYKSISNNDYLYEINGIYNNEDFVLRYFKKNSNEWLCIYNGNECIDNFKKIKDN